MNFNTRKVRQAIMQIDPVSSHLQIYNTTMVLRNREQPYRAPHVCTPPPPLSPPQLPPMIQKVISRASTSRFLRCISSTYKSRRALLRATPAHILYFVLAILCSQSSTHHIYPHAEPTPSEKHPESRASTPSQSPSFPPS